jgi:hypothetical protein
MNKYMNDVVENKTIEEKRNKNVSSLSSFAK